jgi:ectoine hydroxylase-related dioxygenase (phytanoyl-CoA dioxygenase family)
LATALREAKDQAALEEYNEALAEAKGFAEDIANEAEGEFDNKSEKWQEGVSNQAIFSSGRHRKNRHGAAFFSRSVNPPAMRGTPT